MKLEQNTGGYAEQTHDGIRVRVGLPRVRTTIDDGGVRASLRDPSRVRTEISISPLTGTDAWLEYADYRSAQSGLWSLRANWEVYDGVSWAPAKSYPGRNANTRDVTITHDMMMDVSPANAMHDLTIDGYYAFTDGGNSFSISGNFDSTSSEPSFEGGLTMTGTMTLVGSEDQTIEIGTETNGSFCNIVINKTSGTTATIATGISMTGTMTVASGTLDSGNGIIMQHFVKTGGALTGTGPLTFNDTTAHTFTTNEDISVYSIVHAPQNVGGVRTLTFIGTGGTRTVTVNSFERGGRSLGTGLSSAVLAYAAGATLYYSPSGAAMTADADEWPVSGGPDNVEFTGSHNLTVPFTRTTVSFECNGTTSKTITLSGTLTTTNLYRRGTAGGTISGTIVYTADSTLTYYAGDTIIGDEWPATNGPESCVVNLTASSNRCESSPSAAGITRTLTKNFTGVEGILDMGGNDANGILYVEGVVDQQSGFSLEDTEINPVSFDFLNCLAFAGDNDSCLRTATGETTFDSKTQLSIGMWIFIPTGTAANKILWWYGNNSNRDLIVYNDAKSGSLHRIALYCHPNNSTYRTAKTGYVVTENAWHFVVFTYDGAGATDADKVKCKIDDASQSLTFAGGGFPSALPVFSTGGTTRMIFGAGWGLAVQLWAGRIDHAAFYFGVWDDTTKTALYNSGNGADYSLYDLLYKFDGTGTNTTLDDEGALNRDMTLTNFSFDGSTSGWRTHV